MQLVLDSISVHREFRLKIKTIMHAILITQLSLSRDRHS